MASYKNRGDSVRWYDETTDRVGSAVFAIANQLKDDQASRLGDARLYNSMYCNETTSLGSASAYDGAGTLTLNVVRSAVDTCHAEIAGRQKPMAKFLTNGGDWKTKRMAKRIEKNIFGMMKVRQGMYLSAWPLMEDVFRDACIFGDGWVKVFYEGPQVGKRKGRISIERHYGFEIFVDSAEARYGHPRNLFQLHLMDKDLALWRFADDPDLELEDSEREERRYAIMGAETDDGVSTFGGIQATRSVPMIKIVEAWKLAGAKMGRHVIGVGGATLLDEEYKHSSFPFVRVCWNREPVGWDAVGIAREGESIARELNENTDKIQERFRLCSGRRVYFKEGTVDDKYLQENEAEVHIPFTGDQPPIEVNSSPINEAEFTYMTWLHDKFFESTGVSQMRATARKEPGLTAGVAIRTVNDMQTVRFAPKAKAYENAYVDLSLCIINACKDADEAGYPVECGDDDGFSWSDADFDDVNYEISVDPASSLPNDPGGRMQMATELVQLGAISMETYKQMLGWPDLEKEMNYQTAQRRYLEKIIDRYLDEGEHDASVYESPDEHLLDGAGAAVQVAQAYFDSLYNDAPDPCLKLLQRYLVEIDQKIQAKAAIQAQMQKAASPQVAPQQ